jgi:hypothetical protein
MKRVTTITIVILLFALSLPVPRAGAQEDPCETLRSAAYLIFDEYNVVKDTRDIQTVATLQKLRRNLESLDITTCPAYQSQYDDFRWLLNYSADAIIARVTEDAELAADLSLKAIDLYLPVAEWFSGTDVPPPPSASITAPVDGGTVDSYEIIVEGEYDPDLLGDDILWLFVVPQDLHYFPQIVDGCDPAKRASASLVPQTNSWSAKAYLGNEEFGIGETFKIVLLQGGQEAQDFVFGYFDTHCVDQTWPGLTAAEVYGPEIFVHLQEIKVKRTQ